MFIYISFTANDNYLFENTQMSVKFKNYESIILFYKTGQ